MLEKITYSIITYVRPHMLDFSPGYRFDWVFIAIPIFSAPEYYPTMRTFQDISKNFKRKF